MKTVYSQCTNYVDEKHLMKEGAQILRMKMRKAELYLKGATVITPSATCRKIARTSVKVGKTRLLENCTNIRASVFFLLFFVRIAMLIGIIISNRVVFLRK